jgi:hypothetical protein
MLPDSSIEGGHWYVVAAARPRSALAVALAPTQSGVLILALVMFAAAGIGLRRAHAVARSELSGEQAARAQAEHRSRTDALPGLFNRGHAVDEVTHELACSRCGGVSATQPAIAVNDFIPATTAPAHSANTTAKGCSTHRWSRGSATTAKRSTRSTTVESGTPPSMPSARSPADNDDTNTDQVSASSADKVAQ